MLGRDDRGIHGNHHGIGGPGMMGNDRLGPGIHGNDRFGDDHSMYPLACDMSRDHLGRPDPHGRGFGGSLL